MSFELGIFYLAFTAAVLSDLYNTFQDEMDRYERRKQHGQLSK